MGNEPSQEGNTATEPGKISTAGADGIAGTPEKSEKQSPSEDGKKEGSFMQKLKAKLEERDRIK